MAKKYACNPDGVYANHLDELQEKLLWDDCLLPHKLRKVNSLTESARLTVNGKCSETAENLRSGNDRENIYICNSGDVIEYSFENPASISEIRLIFDSDLDRKTLPGGECERKHMTRCNLFPDSPVMHLPTTLCMVFTVSVVCADGTETLLADVTDNARRMVKIKCGESNVTAVRLVMNEANCGGEEMRIFSLDLK